MRNSPEARVLLISITGHDKLGVTHSLMEILGGFSARILDIGQALIHESLTLGILIEMTEDMRSCPMLTDLLLRAHELGVNIRFTAISREEYNEWVRGQSKQRFIITILGPELDASEFAAVSGIVSSFGLNIDRIDRLSGRTPLHDDAPGARVCVEVSASGNLTEEESLRAELAGLTDRFDVDIAFQHESIFRRNRRLVAFDMDSTLIQTEVIDELAGLAGVRDQVAAITEAAMRGELDFRGSFRRRVALLRGLKENRLSEILDKIPLMDGAERLIRTLKRLGYKTAILSGGFTFVGQQLQQRLGIDYVYANELVIRDGIVTGEAGPEIIDGARKAALLAEIAQRESLSMEQVIAVGDGANDLPMLSIAGLGIAFRAKPLVRRSARQAISTLGLDGILYLLGVRDREAVPERVPRL